jgi:nitrite reductase/ring-hydroxylating ferredoxin subunit
MTSVAVALSKDLPNGRVMRAVIADQDLVVWRSKSGKLSAWENRCPHRGMRLSHGFVRGEALACVYHGWHYDKSATCRYIPAHPELEPPETIKAQVFNSVEKSGLIWVSVDDTLNAPAIPDSLIPLRSISYSCPIENLKNVISHSKNGTEYFNFDISEQNSDNCIVQISDHDVSLHLFFQELPNSACKIHALIDKECPSETKKQISRMFEYWRRVAESNCEVSA